MKKVYKIALACLAASISLSVSAAESEPFVTDPWEGSVELGPNIPTKGGDAGLEINFAATRAISPVLRAGFGVSVSESFKFAASPTIPVYVRLRAGDFMAPYSPFINFDMGYAFMTSNMDYSGFYFRPVVGVNYKAWGFGVGYEGIVKGGCNGSVVIALSYRFGYHRSESAFARGLRAGRWGIEAGMVMPFNSEAGAGPMFAFEDMYDISENLEIGATVGLLMIHDKWNGDCETFHAPIAARGRYHFLDTKLRPYAQLDLGLQAGTHTGFYYAPEVGVSYKVYRDHAMRLGLYYAPIKSADKFDWKNGEFEPKKKTGAWGLRLGYQF